MNTKHSPIPWSIDHDDPTLIHENSSGRWRPVAEVFGDGRQNAVANAAFIVKAVNSHARLTEQRDELLVALKVLAADICDENPTYYIKAVKHARAVIAKCEAAQ